MAQKYLEYKVNSEVEPCIDEGSPKFLRKKRFNDQNEIISNNMSLETNNNSDSNSYNTNYMNSKNPYTPDTIIDYDINKKYMKKKENFDLDSDKIKKIMIPFETENSNEEESINANNLYYIQNIKNNIKNKISNEDYEKYGKRKNQKDNISQKLFKNFNDWIIKIIENKIPQPYKKKIYTPDHDIFTHNTNSKDIRFFLDIPFENILIMTKKDKESLDHLLIIKGIKKERKYYETNLNDKELKKAEILLEKLKKIEKNEKIDEKEIINLIIDILIEKGYKSKEEKILFKKDKDNFNQLLVEFEIKKSLKDQENNDKHIQDIKKIKTIEELRMTLRELLLKFFASKSEEFEDFKKKVKENNEYFELLNKFNIFENESKISCGFIHMIEKDCYSK